MAFETLKIRIRSLEAAPARVAARAAPRIEAKLKSDATLKGGSAPPGISASARSDSITVSAPDWVLRIAVERDQPASWAGIVGAAVRAEMKGGS